MKEWTSLEFFGVGQSWTLVIFSGLGDTPFWESTWPRKSTLAWKKKDFFGLILRLNSFKQLNINWILSNIWSAVSAKTTDVIKIEQERDVLLITNPHLHQSTERCTDICYTEGHSCELLKSTQSCPKCGFLDIIFFHGHLEISLGQVERREPYCGLYSLKCLFYSREWERVHDRNCIQLSKVNAEMNFPHFFTNDYYLGCVRAFWRPDYSSF